MIKDCASYLLIRLLLWPAGYLSAGARGKLGKALGQLAYRFSGRYRKRTLSNLALAKDLRLSNTEIIRLAKRSFTNLAINFLEYATFHNAKNFNEIVTCQNPQTADLLFQKGQGIIFFCAHQANWETLFLEGNTHLKGVAIAKPIKNRELYNWIVSIREKTGGVIISHKEALKKGLAALRQGLFLGILADQGMPESTYSYPFLGRNAHTTTAPALLSYRTGAPIIVATTVRENGKYRIRYSDPIWPNRSALRENEIKRLMDLALFCLENSIREHIDQWLWQHNRWKRLTPHRVYKKYRHDTLLVIMPCKKEGFDRANASLPLLKEIYGPTYMAVLTPRETKLSILPDETIYYDRVKGLRLVDYRFKLVLTFQKSRAIKRHYKALSAFDVVTLPLERTENFMKNTLCRKGTI